MNDGWVKLSDPNTGKDFYANKFTRQTQWDPPPGFVDPAAAAAPTPTPPVANRHHHHHPQNPSSTNESDLPPGWERMLDKGSGKYFYVDHANQKTSWEHPGKAAAAAANHAASGYAGNGSMSSSSVSGSSVQPRGTATGFGFVPASSSSNGYGASTANNNSNNSNNSNNRGSAMNAMNAGMNRSAATATASWGTNPTSSSSSTKHPHAHPHAHEYAFQASRSFTSTIDDMSSKYYSTSQSHAQSMPSLEFTIVKIPDHLRASCPISKTIFTLSKRRHHCRLCGDIFADAACSNRVLLPLSGPEYEKPVRVCDGCHADIDRGDYFSMRRYLPTLCLYDGDRDRTAELQRTYGSGSGSGGGGDTNEDGSRVESITATNVAAALTSLAQDLNAVLSDPTSFQEKVTIEADRLLMRRGN